MKQITLLLLLLLYPIHNEAVPFSSSSIMKMVNHRWFLPVIGVTSLVLTNAITHWYMQQKIFYMQDSIRETVESAVTNAVYNATNDFIKKQNRWIELLKKEGIEIHIIPGGGADTEDKVYFENIDREKLNIQNKYMVEVGFEHQICYKGGVEYATYVYAKGKRLQKELKEVRRACEKLSQENKLLRRMKATYAKNLEGATSIIATKDALLNYGLDEVALLGEKLKNLKTVLERIQTTIVMPDDLDPRLVLEAFEGIEFPFTETNDNKDPARYINVDPINQQRRAIITFLAQKPLAPSKSSLTLSPPPSRPSSQYISQPKG